MSDSNPDNTPTASVPPASAAEPAAPLPTAATAPLPPQPPVPGAPAPGAHDAAAPGAGKRPFLRRTGVRIAGAAVAAVLLLGGGFGAG